MGISNRKLTKQTNIFGTLIKGLKRRTKRAATDPTSGRARRPGALAGRQTNLTLTKTTTASDGLCIMLITSAIYSTLRAECSTGYCSFILLHAICNQQQRQSQRQRQWQQRTLCCRTLEPVLQNTANKQSDVCE